MRIVLAGVLSVLLVSLAAADATVDVDPAIRAFVENWESKAKSIKALPQDDAGRIAADCGELTGDAFDFAAMLPVSLPEIWARLNAGQRSALASAVAKKAASDCVERIRDYDGAPFTILGVRAGDGGDQLATADVRSAGGRDMHVTWRLRSGAEGRWQAVDMIVEGRSMTASIRERFNRFLMSHNGNVATAIAMMSGR